MQPAAAESISVVDNKKQKKKKNSLHRSCTGSQSQPDHCYIQCTYRTLTRSGAKKSSSILFFLLRTGRSVFAHGFRWGKKRDFFFYSIIFRTRRYDDAGRRGIEHDWLGRWCVCYWIAHVGSSWFKRGLPEQQLKGSCIQRSVYTYSSVQHQWVGGYWIGL